MTALTEDRDTFNKFKQRKISIGVAASTTIYAGALVGIQAGYLVPAANTAGIRPIGRAEAYVDNSSGSAGDLDAEVGVGVFNFVNDSSNPVVVANIGYPCYVLDDQTVANVAGTAGVIAGIVEEVNSFGVMVRCLDIGEAIQNGGIDLVTVGAISLFTRSTNLSVTGTKAYTLADGLFEGQRKSLYCTVAATTPDGTITPVTLAGGATLDVDAVSESYELEWHEADGWNVLNITGGAIT
jgi:hypothetical protein